MSYQKCELQSNFIWLFSLAKFFEKMTIGELISGHFSKRYFSATSIGLDIGNFSDRWPWCNCDSTVICRQCLADGERCHDSKGPDHACCTGFSCQRSYICWNLLTMSFPKYCYKDPDWQPKNINGQKKSGNSDKYYDCVKNCKSKRNESTMGLLFKKFCGNISTKKPVDSLTIINFPFI